MPVFHVGYQLTAFLAQVGIFIASFYEEKPFNLYKTIINKDGQRIKQFIQCSLSVGICCFALNPFKSVCVT